MLRYVLPASQVGFWVYASLSFEQASHQYAAEYDRIAERGDAFSLLLFEATKDPFPRSAFDVAFALNLPPVLSAIPVSLVLAHVVSAIHRWAGVPEIGTFTLTGATFIAVFWHVVGRQLLPTTGSSTRRSSRRVLRVLGIVVSVCFVVVLGFCSVAMFLGGTPGYTRYGALAWFVVGALWIARTIRRRSGPRPTARSSN